MTENNNAPVPPQTPPPPPPPPPAGEDLQAELSRSRSRNKALKVTLILLATLFVLLGVAAFTVYRKIMQTKEAVEEAFQAFPQQAVFQPENRTLPGGGPSVFSSTGMPASSLGLFSGGLPDAQPVMSPEQAEKVVSAMNKYAERPIVKEFIADLKKNPDMAKAFEMRKGSNPLAMIAAVQNAKGMDAVMAKYASRPEFLSLLLEISRDPAMAAVSGALPGGMVPSMGAPQARPVPGPGRAPAAEPADQDGDGAMTLDTSAISGAPAPPPPTPPKKEPSPVDTEL